MHKTLPYPSVSFRGCVEVPTVVFMLCVLCMLSDAGSMSGRYLGINARQICQELGGHSMQGISRPLTEPVNGGTVDQAGELTQPLPELPTHWAETQHHVQVMLHLRAHTTASSSLAFNIWPIQGATCLNHTVITLLGQEMLVSLLHCDCAHALPFHVVHYAGMLVSTCNMTQPKCQTTGKTAPAY